MAKKNKAKAAKKQVSKPETLPPDAAEHEGEIWHKPFSYTYKGHEVKVPGHWERKAGAGPRPKEAKPAKPRKGKKETVLQRRQRTATEAKAKADAKKVRDKYVGRDPNGPSKDEAEPITPVAMREDEAVGAKHHEAEQAAARFLGKLKAAQQPVPLEPVKEA